LQEPWNRFWERLIVESVGILVLLFVLQGVWFGLVTALEAWKPVWEGSLNTASRRFMVLWFLAVAGGMVTVTVRALGARMHPGRR
jgi:hypothetical protein